MSDVASMNAAARAERGSMPSLDGVVVGIDTGGTFTDIVVLHPDGQVTINKSATTPKNFAQGVVDAVGIAAQTLGISSSEFLERTSMFKHGTTVATNALI